jgi:hypothetical protein
MPAGRKGPNNRNERQISSEKPAYYIGNEEKLLNLIVQVIVKIIRKEVE